MLSILLEELSDLSTRTCNGALGRSVASNDNIQPVHREGPTIFFARIAPTRRAVLAEISHMMSYTASAEQHDTDEAAKEA